MRAGGDFGNPSSVPPGLGSASVFSHKDSYLFAHKERSSKWVEGKDARVVPSLRSHQ
jgi:hypothetical protein